VGRVGIPMGRVGWGELVIWGDLTWGDFDLGRVGRWDEIALGRVDSKPSWEWAAHLYCIDYRFTTTTTTTLIRLLYFYDYTCAELYHIRSKYD